MIYSILLVSIIAGLTGYGLNEARHSATLPLMRMSLPKSIALWFAIMAILGSFVAGLYWAKDVGAL